ncbi:MAG: SusC/RagA family TonB-linked outer membrane protein, partial [Bacteroidota bacterium]|nr:SusC/RagA family TonB-linked outer membrane protein [Bacteroidota bacterium]
MNKLIPKPGNFVFLKWIPRQAHRRMKLPVLGSFLLIATAHSAFADLPNKAIRHQELLHYKNLKLDTKFSKRLQVAVSGKVTSAKGEAIPGVTVVLKGTTIGTVTSGDGSFSLNIPDDQGTLIFSFIGYVTKEEAVNGRSTFNVTLVEDTKSLQEVVVTALGITREKKSLGYAAQDVSGAELDKARETNFVSSLAGKVAGVTIMNSASGVGGSSRITIRGDKSLNINNNQPLFVVDGIPINNENYGAGGGNYQNVDYGNAASMINPDDVESISVLKGANAAALYGSRAANGVILITTKSGKNAKGLGISVNSGVTFDKPLVLPKFQKVYGQGNDGEFAFQDGLGSGVRDGVDESWGPRFEGQLIPQFDSPTANGYRGGDIDLVNDGVLGSEADLLARGAITPTPWLAKFNLKDFYETGVSYNNNIAFSGNNERGNFRVSYTNLDQKGILPNNDLKRNTFAFNGGFNLTPKLNVSASANYIKTNSDNRPSISYGTENVMYLLNIWMGQQVDMNSLKNYWMAGKENSQQFNFNYNYHDNPYFQLYENTNSQNANRMIGNITLKYNLTDWLNIMLRGGTDFSNDIRQRRRAFSTQRFPFGGFREERLQNTETNLDFLVSANRNVGEKFAFGINLGGNKRIID